ncbi:MAG: phosphatidylglycerol lysyltransferase domain-containing protein [Candidatus Omnitrophota bacterium]
MELQPLTLRDRPLLERYLRQQPHDLSVYSFANTWIWRSLFEIKWAVIRDRFCLFFQNNVGCFMTLPPLGGFQAGVVEECFEIMDRVNLQPEISRIENIEHEEQALFAQQGLRTTVKSEEYVVSQNDMAALAGEGFKHKRNLCNFFEKNHNALFRPYDPKDKQGVFKLYDVWMQERLSKNSEPIYQAMLKDSRGVFGELLAAWPQLEMIGYVVENKERICGFTCGFAVSNSMFCINFEIADLRLKGLAQFMFHEFSKTLTQYPEINIMDDSDLANIRRAKLSYRPSRLVPCITALKSS